MPNTYFSELTLCHGISISNDFSVVNYIVDYDDNVDDVDSYDYGVASDDDNYHNDDKYDGNDGDNHDGDDNDDGANDDDDNTDDSDIDNDY